MTMLAVRPIELRRTFMGDCPVEARLWFEDFVSHLLEVVGLVHSEPTINIETDPSTGLVSTILSCEYVLLAEAWHVGHRFPIAQANVFIPAEVTQ